MKLVKKDQLPSGSILYHDNGIFDFVEAYDIMIKRNDMGLNELISAFFKSIPGWLKWLLFFRISLEKVDGSKPGYSEGDIIGPFHLFRLINNEVVLGINAKHLDYRISLLIKRNKSNGLCFSTAFTINSFIGKCQFIFLKTIYRLATPSILQSMSLYI